MITGAIRVTAKTLPTFLWDRAYNANNIQEGMLQSQLLARVCYLPS